MSLFEGPARRAKEIAEQVRSGSRVPIVGAQGTTLLLYETADLLGPAAVLVRVPRDLDKTAYVLLSAAAQCGPEPLRMTAAGLAAHQEDPSKVLKILDAALGERPLLVDAIDAFEGQSVDRELRAVFEPSLRKVSEWLEGKASVITRATSAKDPVQDFLDGPRSSEDWDAQNIWMRVGRDVELFTLAVARTLLLGVPDHDPSLRWDAASILDDLWDGTTQEIRDLLALLAVHGRPIGRGQLDGLGLVPAATIEMGLRSHLLDRSRDVLELSASSRWEGRLSPSERRALHQRLAKAFARVAHEAASPDLAPLAVLEAHRHYAAVPAIESAREFARFGVQMLLVSAKNSSLDARYNSRLYDRSSRTYALALELDEQVRAAGDAGGIGSQARAYAIHYRAYNRYKAGPNAPLETLAAYREALSVWPQNALFWSRTIGCCFVAERYEEGMRARDEALSAVPKHPQRSALVIVRTVEHLLRGDRILAAILVWRDYRPENLIAWKVENDLRERMAKGWTESHIWAPGTPPLVFRSPVRVCIITEERLFLCNLGGRSARGPTPEAALLVAMKGIFSELGAAIEDPSPSSECAVRRRELTEMVSLQEMQSAGEEVRWLAYLATLDGLVACGEVTEAQRHRLLETWRRARQRFPGLRRPAVGRADGRLHLGWSFDDPQGVTLTIDFERDGRVDWFYRNAAENRTTGTEDEPEGELPEEALSLLAAFVP